MVRMLILTALITTLALAENCYLVGYDKDHTTPIPVKVYSNHMTMGNVTLTLIYPNTYRGRTHDLKTQTVTIYPKRNLLVIAETGKQGLLMECE